MAIIPANKLAPSSRHSKGSISAVSKGKPASKDALKSLKEACQNLTFFSLDFRRRALNSPRQREAWEEMSHQIRPPSFPNNFEQHPPPSSSLGNGVTSRASLSAVFCFLSSCLEFCRSILFLVILSRVFCFVPYFLELYCSPLPNGFIVFLSRTIETLQIIVTIFRAPCIDMTSSKDGMNLSYTDSQNRTLVFNLVTHF